MSFVHPGYLWFLSLLALPILIHLFYFRKHKRLYFPSLKYLTQQDQEKKSVRNLKKLLVLCCRLLFLTALILAFAQPYSSTEIGSKGGVSITAIYLDNSLSMSAKGVEGELLSEARELAKKLVSESPSGTKFMIFTNSLSGTERTVHTKSTAVKYIDNITYNRCTKNLGAVLKWQDEYLRRYHQEIEPVAQFHRIIISDFQKKTSTVSEYEPLKNALPEKTSLVQCIAQRKDNLFIDSVWMETPVHRPGQQMKINYRLVNNGLLAIENASITLDFDGKKRMNTLNINAASTLSSYFYVTPSSVGFIEGKLNVSDRSVSWDDNFYFINQISDKGKVVVLNGPNASPNPTKALRTEPFFNVEEFSALSFSTRLLDQLDLLVLNGLDNIPDGMAQEIINFEAMGRNVLIIPSININLSDYNALLTAFNFPKMSSLSSEGNQITDINYQHPFFQGMFEKEKKDLNLPLIKSSYPLRNHLQSQCTALMTYRNKLPFLIKNSQRGSVYLMTASIDPSNGAIADHAVFPSLMLRTSEMSLRAIPYYFTIGGPSNLQLEQALNEDRPISLKESENTLIPKQMKENNQVKIRLNSPEILEKLKEGFYTIHNDGPIGKIALNLDRAESNMTYLNEETVLNLFKNLGFSHINYGKMDQGSKSFQLPQNDNPSYWPLLIMLALFFLFAEMFLLKFLI